MPTESATAFERWVDDVLASAVVIIEPPPACVLPPIVESREDRLRRAARDRMRRIRAARRAAVVDQPADVAQIAGQNGEVVS